MAPLTVAVPIPVGSPQIANHLTTAEETPLTLSPYVQGGGAVYHLKGSMASEMAWYPPRMRRRGYV
jgi:hypothetical protein